jgi:hypothetical protein
MRFVYETTGTPLIAEIGADIVAVLTGETDKNNLVCANIVLANTSITANTPAGWELWDSGWATNQYVLRAPTVDDPTQFKYIRLVFSTFSSIYYSCVVYGMDSWNNVSHTATNETSALSSNMMRYPSATYGVQPMLFYATERFIWFSPTTPGTSQVNDSQFWCLEVDRVHPCLGIGKGRIPSFQVGAWYNNTSSSNPLGRIPRFIDDEGATELTNVQLFPFVNNTPHCFFTTSPGLSVMSQLGIDRATDKDGAVYYGAYQLQFERHQLYGGMAGTSILSNIYIMMGDGGGAVGPVNDEIVYLKDVGTMRVRHAQADLSGDGSPRYLFRVEDE